MRIAAGLTKDMKHRRSVELAPPHDYAVDMKTQTLTTLPQWFVIHARCRACRHLTALERWNISRRCGADLSLAQLARRLTCRACGNRSDNLLLLETLPRD